MLKYLELKVKLREKLENELDEGSKKKALKDEHSKRKPIGCGFTIHPAYGCTNRCLYCYIQDLGLEFTRIKLNELNGKELAYALAINPYIVPKKSFLAFGSICDPFHPLVKNKTIEYMENVKDFGYIQFSTKFDPKYNLETIDKNMSGLITIVTIKKKDILEPNAPEIEERIEFIKRTHIKCAIFLRPIIPGITDDEIEDIVNLASSLNVPIVLGIFRATEKNLERLSKYFDISEIKRRLKVLPKGRRQVDLEMKDIIEKAIKICEKYNVRYFLRASCHNAWAHKTLNPTLEFLKGGCVNCGNKCWEKIEDEKEIEEFLKYLGYKKFEIKGNKVIFKEKIKDWVAEWLRHGGYTCFCSFAH